MLHAILLTRTLTHTPQVSKRWVGPPTGHTYSCVCVCYFGQGPTRRISIFTRDFLVFHRDDLLCAVHLGTDQCSTIHRRGLFWSLSQLSASHISRASHLIGLFLDSLALSFIHAPRQQRLGHSLILSFPFPSRLFGLSSICSYYTPIERAAGLRRHYRPHSYPSRRHPRPNTVIRLLLLARHWEFHLVFTTIFAKESQHRRMRNVDPSQ